MSKPPLSNALASDKNAEVVTKVKSKSQVFSCLQAHMFELQQLGVSKCGVFGSFVRGTNIQEDSDVDILVVFEPHKKTFDNFMALIFRLEELLGRPVDLVTADSLSPYIGPHILREVE